MKVKCNEIKIGERVRQDLGDIDSLANSINIHGLLQPIGITKDNELVFGERRLAACKALEHEEIEVIVIDSDELLECETTENVDRKGFVMSERVAIRKIFKEKEIEKRGKMIAKGIKIPKSYPKLGSKQYQSKLAKLTGISHATADKENVIVAFGDQLIIDQVDNNELSVSKAYNLVKQMKKEAEAKDNKVNVLPAEETVDVEVEEPDVDNNIYTITISDDYGSLELPETLSNKIKHCGGITYMESVFNQMFENYIM